VVEFVYFGFFTIGRKFMKHQLQQQQQQQHLCVIA
jgi:hypothetical protein